MNTSKITTARKEHKCDYCYKPIYMGEKYLRHKGIQDGEWFSLSYCLRCNKVTDFLFYAEEWEYEDMHGFTDDILYNDYIVCPKCGSALSFNNIQKDTVDYRCRNTDCDDVGRIDISLDAIMKILELNMRKEQL